MSWKIEKIWINKILENILLLDLSYQICCLIPDGARHGSIIRGGGAIQALSTIMNQISCKTISSLDFFCTWNTQNLLENKVFYQEVFLYLVKNKLASLYVDKIFRRSSFICYFLTRILFFTLKVPIKECFKNKSNEKKEDRFCVS